MTNRKFRSFVESERHRLVSFVRARLVETADADAEDIVQDVLLRLVERGDAQSLDNLAGYVYRALRNRVIDRLRTKKDMVSLDHETGDSGDTFADLLRDVSPGSLETLQSAEGRTALFTALEKLSAIERAVIIQHEFEGAPFKELSENMQVPVNTLLSHKSRALKKLKEYFKETHGGGI